jgi:hypothetical protein
VFLLKMTSPGRERKRLFSCVITGRKELLPWGAWSANIA